jgi:hypothetical protein
MKLTQVRDILNAEAIAGIDDLDTDVSLACASDLMSDVLAFSSHGALLITSLTHSQVIRTAEMADVLCVCFVRGKLPPTDTLELAVEKNIILLSTSLTMYDACGRLYTEGLKGCSL